MIKGDFSAPSAPIRHDVLDLTSEAIPLMKGAEVYRKKITGGVRALKKNTFCNVIESVFEGAQVEEADLSETDFKDCVFRKSLFARCRLDVLSFATDTFIDCDFSACTFSNSTIQNCLFRHVSFRNCDFSRLLIKECRFENCFFEDCKTSNKLFEMCFIVDSRFIRVDIQVDTVLGNFGLKSSDLNECRIRNGRPDAGFEYVSLGDFRAAAERVRERVPALVDFRLDYFEKGSLLGESPGLDRAFDLDSWKDVSRNPASFLEVYRGFSEFLIFLYENDHLYFHQLLRLHDLSGDFLVSARTLPFEMGALIMGVHQQLSIFVEDVFILAESIAARCGPQLDFLVLGPTTSAEVEEVLYPWFSTPEKPVITNLKPQNSPWHLSIDFLSQSYCVRAVLLLLATRVKSKIVAIKAQTAKGASRAHTIATPRSLVELGPIRDNSATFGYGVSVLLPKNRLLEFQLAFDTRTLSRMAAFLIALG